MLRQLEAQMRVVFVGLGTGAETPPGFGAVVRPLGMGSGRGGFPYPARVGIFHVVLLAVSVDLGRARNLRASPRTLEI